MNSYNIKTLAFNNQVRILFMDNTNLIKEICNHDHISTLLKSALGTTLSVASLISGILTESQRMSLKVNMTNPKYKIFADTDSYGNVRGYLSDDLINAPLNDLTLGELIGPKGSIRVVQDSGNNNIFTGITDMPHANIMDDFSYYFNKSEQIPTHITLNIGFDENNNIHVSRGIFAQLLPGASIKLMDQIKKRISEHYVMLFDMDNDLRVNENILGLFEDSKIVDIRPLQFFCGCSKEMLYGMLYSLTKEELADAVLNHKSMEMVCNICGEKYSFSETEIKKLL